jgi:DNA ligase-1
MNKHTENSLIGKLEKVHTFLQEMRSTTSNNEKLEILKKHKDNAFLERVFHYTYNGFYKYYVHTRNVNKRPDLIKEDYASVGLFYLLDGLRKRNITGHDSIAAINGFTQYLTPKSKEVFFHILDRDLQMRASTSSINKVFKNCIPTFNCALAAGYNPGMVDFENENEQWYGSRKLDGVRCLAFKQGNDVKFTSRSGKEFLTLDKVKEEILSLNHDGDFILDGEMCIMSNSGADDFQGIIKEIRRKGHTIEKPKFLVFDCLTFEEFESKTGTRNLEERLTFLNGNLINPINANYIEVLDQIHLTSEEQFAEMVADAEKQGFEGIMVRKNTSYEGKRSKNLLKVKKFHDEEYIVKDVVLGDMRFVENGKEVIKDVLSNILIEHKGYEVGVGSGFSKEQREYYYKNPKELIGKTVTIQFFEETQNQSGGLSLRFPVVKHIYANGRQC